MTLLVADTMSRRFRAAYAMLTDTPATLTLAATTPDAAMLRHIAAVAYDGHADAGPACFFRAGAVYAIPYACHATRVLFFAAFSRYAAAMMLLH